MARACCVGVEKHSERARDRAENTPPALLFLSSTALFAARDSPPSLLLRLASPLSPGAPHCRTSSAPAPPTASGLPHASSENSPGWLSPMLLQTVTPPASGAAHLQHLGQLVAEVRALAIDNRNLRRLLHRRRRLGWRHRRGGGRVGPQLVFEPVQQGFHLVPTGRHLLQGVLETRGLPVRSPPPPGTRVVQFCCDWNRYGRKPRNTARGYRPALDRTPGRRRRRRSEGPAEADRRPRLAARGRPVLSGGESRAALRRRAGRGPSPPRAPVGGIVLRPAGRGAGVQRRAGHAGPSPDRPAHAQVRT